MDPVKFVVADAGEQKSGTYRAMLRDENGQPIGALVLVSLTLSLYDLRTLTTINSRGPGQSVLNANQVTLDALGTLTWTWLPADMTILNPNLQVEEHVALFEAKWFDVNVNPRQANHEVHFLVNRIPQLT